MEEIRERNSISVPESDRLTAGSIRVSRVSPSSASQSWNKKVNLNGYRCLKGTVPIRRTSREELLGAESFSKSIMLSHVRAPNEIIVQPPGQHVAIRQSTNSTQEDPVIPYRGLKADVKIDNPSSVEKDQQSASLLWLESGTADNFTTIQAGWMDHIFNN
ncbi:hypothetical protein C5167_001272 [Papaver somniferum]|uniref:Uncharacterized protein n=1 Tax=Papaver somniferum TaxID=3469 RepID=A0A4Y7KYX0_PAPSO|nr:hypothetical protein C5167_001272 [Papaver somniferum]